MSFEENRKRHAKRMSVLMYIQLTLILILIAVKIYNACCRY